MPGMVEIAPLPPVPLHDLFTYRVPEGLAGRVLPGMRVRVPLGRQTRTGVVTGFAEAAPPAERALRLVRTLEPEELARLARRAPARARAYELLRNAPASTLTLAAARSAGLGAGVLRTLRTAGLAEAIRVDPVPPALQSPSPEAPPALSAAQRRAVDALAAALAADAPASFLLHGVTGSGKTEVFLAAAEAALARGRSVLVLVPEIALTHQAVERVRARFGERVALLHSALAPRERWSEWRRVREGR